VISFIGDANIALSFVQFDAYLHVPNGGERSEFIL